MEGKAAAPGGLPGRPALRWALVAIESFVALGACCGSLLVIAPSGRLLGMPTELLARSPFRTYLVPGLVLLLAVGGSMAVAAIAELRRRPRAALLSLAAGLVLIGWMVAQIHWIGLIDAQQPLLLGCGLAIAVLGLLQHRAGRPPCRAGRPGLDRISTVR